MTKYFLENNDNFEIKDDTIFLYLKDEKEIMVNTNNNPINSGSRIYLENGDNIGVSNNIIYVESLKTKVIVNGKTVYQMFPPFVSDDFQEFCTNAVLLKKEVIGESEYVIANFNLDGFTFQIIAPNHKNGYYRFIFRNILPELTDNPSLNVSLMSKFKFHNFEVETGDEVNILTLKTKRFDYNNLYHTIHLLSQIKGRNNNFRTGENYTA